MKNSSRIISTAKIFFLFISILGMIFRLQLWKGASEMLIIGLCSLAFLFAFEFQLQKKKRIPDFLWFIGASTACMGYLFKVQHWQGQDNLLYPGIAAAAIGFILRNNIQQKDEREKKDAE